MLVSDALWPSNNEWGIPTLDLALQAQFVDLPVVKWGTIRRSSMMQGTYHFYTDDYKFNGLWTNPSSLLQSRCVNIIEPNFSTNEQMPAAVALYKIYQKRWLARYCQHVGIRVFVDLCIEPQFAELNLTGVPQGWRSYANRGYQDDRFYQLETGYELACERRGSEDVLYVVYGGGKMVRQLCQERNWVWIPENSDEKRQRFVDDVKRLEDAARVQKVRELLASEELTQKEIAALVGVSEATVSDIKRNKTWKSDTE